MRQGLMTAMGIVVLMGCSQENPSTVSDLTEVQQIARITIPPAAAELHYQIERGIDSLVYGRFEIAATELPMVLAGMPQDSQVEPYSGYSNVTAHSISASWWQPNQLQEPQIAEWSEPGFSVNLMFGNTGSPAQVTVYFFNFEL